MESNALMNPLENIDYSKDFEKLSAEEKYERAQQLLAKLSKDVRGMLYEDPVAYMVFNQLLRGADPYKIIEQLLAERQNTLKYLDTNVINNPVMKTE